MGRWRRVRPGLHCTGCRPGAPRSWGDGRAARAPSVLPAPPAGFQGHPALPGPTVAAGAPAGHKRSRVPASVVGGRQAQATSSSNQQRRLGGLAARRPPPRLRLLVCTGARGFPRAPTLAMLCVGLRRVPRTCSGAELRGGERSPARRGAGLSPQSRPGRDLVLESPGGPRADTTRGLQTARGHRNG